MKSTPRTHFLCCVPVEGAVTALGYFHASIAAFYVLFCLRNIVSVLCNFILHPTPQDHSDGEYRYIDQLPLMLVSVLVLGISLMLAIFLLVGVKKRLPGFVLTYFILGVLGVLTVTAMNMYCLLELSLRLRYTSYVYNIEIFLELFVYSLFLVMVYFEHRNIKLEKESNHMDYNVLQENHHYANITQKNVV